VRGSRRNSTVTSEVLPRYESDVAAGQWREVVAVTIAMAVVTLVMTYPVVRVGTTALPNDPGDPLLNAWILAWDADRIRHGLYGLWDLPAFFPYPHTLLYTEHL